MQLTEHHLLEPLDAIAFDCDGTLSRIEGINELARQNGVSKEVDVLTEQAMSQAGITTELYAKRLCYVRPSYQQLEQLGHLYYATRSQDIDAVLTAFKKLDKAIFIISAGMNPSVKVFADLLGVSDDHVYAVDVLFDEQLQYRDFDRAALPSMKRGKCRVLQLIKQRYPRVMLVGDGMNDFEASDCVSRFVGYGGNFYRENIKQHCDYYIESASCLPMIALGTTEQEYRYI